GKTAAMSRASSSGDVPTWFATNSSRPRPNTWPSTAAPDRSAATGPIDRREKRPCADEPGVTPASPGRAAASECCLGVRARGPGGSLAVPRDGPRDALVEVDLDLVAEALAGERDVGLRMGHVTGPRRIEARLDV